MTLTEDKNKVNKIFIECYLNVKLWVCLVVPMCGFLLTGSYTSSDIEAVSENHNSIHLTIVSF